MDIPVESLDGIAEGLRRIEAPFKADGDHRGLWWGAAAYGVEQAAAEIRRITILEAELTRLRRREQMLEEFFCDCGAGHGSNEGHTKWCKWHHATLRRVDPE